MSLALAALGAAGGAIVGSFLATLCLRWPRGEQVMTGRSRCDGCSRELKPLELVPVASALASRGRCRTCGTPIAGLHLQVELAGTALAGGALYLQPNAGGAALALFWLLLLAPAVLDARDYWLPDRLTLLVGISGLALGSYVSGASLADRLIGGACGFLALWLLAYSYKRYRGREGLGAGDAKLLGAIGLWTGWVALPAILLIASLVGIAIAAAKGLSRVERMPFGTLLAAGAILWSAWSAAALRGAVF